MPRPKKGKTLTPREAAFCRHYSISHRGSESCRLAGYRGNNLNRIADQLLNKPHVIVKIKELDEANYKRLQATADQVLAELANLGFSNIADLVWKEGELDLNGQPTRAGELKPLHELPVRVQRQIKKYKIDQAGNPDIELHPKDPSLDRLCKHFGLTNEDRESKISGTIRLIWDDSEDAGSDNKNPV